MTKNTKQPSNMNHKHGSKSLYAPAMGFAQEKSVKINFALYLQNINFSW